MRVGIASESGMEVKLHEVESWGVGAGGGSLGLVAVKPGRVA